MGFTDILTEVGKHVWNEVTKKEEKPKPKDKPRCSATISGFMNTAMDGFPHEKYTGISTLRGRYTVNAGIICNSQRADDLVNEILYADANGISLDTVLRRHLRD